MSPIDTFDASEQEERKSSSYISRKDLKIAAIGFLAMATLGAPIYLYMKKDAEKHTCKTNMQQIMKAISIYMEDNNDRFPVAYSLDPSGAPLYSSGSVTTWLSTIRDYKSSSGRFTCPSAERSENVKNDHGSGAFESSYGMYLPRSGMQSSTISDPGNAVLFAETSNHGSKNTFNPSPFLMGDESESRYDGFAIGWDKQQVDNNGYEFFLRPALDASFVTRLAMYDTKDGSFENTKPSRHPTGVYAITVDGRLLTITPAQARINRPKANSNELSGLWSTR